MFLDVILKRCKTFFYINQILYEFDENRKYFVINKYEKTAMP